MNAPGRVRWRRRGFTLIELMLVVIIIGIIAAIAVPRMAGRTQKAKLVAARADLGALTTALDGFELDAGRFPSTEEGLEALKVMPASLTKDDGWDGPYLRDIPIGAEWGTLSYFHMLASNLPEAGPLLSLSTSLQQRNVL